MKTLSIFSRKALLLAVAAVTFALPGRAQLIQNTYLNVDWQVTVPLGSAFADKASGWGMNFEGGYFVTPEITVGAFISYQTNIESIGRQTLQLGSGAAMTTAQKHTLFELPFGVVGRYNFLKGSVFQPYAGLRIGADYAEMSSYYYTIQQYQDTWGVYLSPEIGVSIFPACAAVRLPRSALLQLRQQQRRSVDLYDEQHQSLRRARRYLVLTAPRLKRNGCL